METDGLDGRDAGRDAARVARPIALAAAARRDRRRAPELGQAAPADVAAVGYFRPRLVRRRLERLRALGHVDASRRSPQLLVAGRDQMMVSAAEETKLFYRSQGIPWVFHNLRRFISGPATMLDPIGLFAPRDTLVHHVLQTFHRHPLYDLVLLRAHEGGVEAMAAQARQILDGTHPHQRALTSLIEDGAYHAAPAARHRGVPGRPTRAAAADPRRAGGRGPPDAGDGSVQGRRAGSRATPRAYTSAWARRSRPGWRRGSTRRWGA